MTAVMIIFLWGGVGCACILRAGYIKSTKPLTIQNFQSYFTWMMMGLMFALTLIPATMGICMTFNIQ